MRVWSWHSPAQTNLCSHVSPAQGLLGLHQAASRTAFKCTPVSRCLFTTWDSGPWGCPYEMAAELSRLSEKSQAKREKRVEREGKGRKGSSQEL